MPVALVTGGAGFIGSHLVEALLDRDYEVTVLDDLSTGNLENLALCADNPRFSFTHGQVEDPELLSPVIKAADQVFHLAAGVGVRKIMNSPVRTIESNVKGALSVFRESAHHNKRLIVTSTSEVYGLSTDVPFSESAEHVLGPVTGGRWGYAASKLLHDYLAMAYHREQGLKVTVVRLFNTVGPRQSGEYGMVIPRFVRQALEGKPLTVYGNGLQTRCFLHVNDAVEGLIRLAENQAAEGEAFNIGSTRETTILDLARQVWECVAHHRNQLDGPENFPKDPSISFFPVENLYDGNFEDMDRRVPDIAKIQQWTGWRPKLPLARIINDVISFLEHKGDRPSSSQPETDRCRVNNRW